LAERVFVLGEGGFLSGGFTDFAIDGVHWFVFWLVLVARGDGERIAQSGIVV
jgi:hypothetical protein